MKRVRTSSLNYRKELLRIIVAVQVMLGAVTVVYKFLNTAQPVSMGGGFWSYCPIRWGCWMHKSLNACSQDVWSDWDWHIAVDYNMELENGNFMVTFTWACHMMEVCGVIMGSNKDDSESGLYIVASFTCCTRAYVVVMSTSFYSKALSGNLVIRHLQPTVVM